MNWCYTNETTIKDMRDAISHAKHELRYPSHYPIYILDGDNPEPIPLDHKVKDYKNLHGYNPPQYIIYDEQIGTEVLSRLDYLIMKYPWDMRFSLSNRFQWEIPYAIPRNPETLTVNLEFKVCRTPDGTITLYNCGDRLFSAVYGSCAHRIKPFNPKEWVSTKFITFKTNRASKIISHREVDRDGIELQMPIVPLYDTYLK